MQTKTFKISHTFNKCNDSGENVNALLQLSDLTLKNKEDNGERMGIKGLHTWDF